MNLVYSGLLVQTFDTSKEHKEIFLCVRRIHDVLCGIIDLCVGYSYICIGDITAVINS